MEQKWFEMPDERRRKLEGAVWIPLRASIRTDEVGVYGDRGYKSEFYGVGTLAVAANDRAKAGKLDWMDVGISHCHSGGIERGEYVPADVRRDYGDTPGGLYLVLEQRGNRDEHGEWH